MSCNFVDYVGSSAKLDIFHELMEYHLYLKF